MTSDVADAAVTSWGTVVVKNDGTVWAMGQSPELLGLDGQPINSPFLQEVLLEGRMVTISTSGSGSTTGAGGYALGTEANVTATPSAGYTFSHWEGDGVTDANASATTVNLDSDRTLTAVFTPLSYELTVLSGTGGLASGSGTYSYNSDANLSATPATGYLFDSWTGSGIADANSASTTIRITADQNVSASFTPIIYDLNLTLGLGGLVDGNGSYAYGSDANLSATPDLGYLFAGWSGDLNSSDANVTVTVTGNLEINVTFIQDTNDNDGDDLTNYQELVTHSSDPDNNDTDGDGLLDGVEVSVGLDPTVAHTDLMNLFALREVEARQRGVDEGNASGQALVVANPSEFSLITEVDKNASDASAFVTGLADGNTTGKDYVVANHLLYALYNQSFKDAMDLGAYLQGKQEGEPLGLAYAQDHPSEFGLYDEPAKSLLDAEAYEEGMIEGNASGIDYGLANPALLTLFTDSEKNASDLNFRTIGFMEGNTSGILFVGTNPHLFNLYTEWEKNQSDESFRISGLGDGNTSGIAHAVANPSKYDLFTQTQVDEAVAQARSAGLEEGRSLGIVEATTRPHLYELVTQAEQVIALIEANASGLMEGNETGIDIVLGSPRNYQLYTEGDVEMDRNFTRIQALFEANATAVFRVSARPGDYAYYSLFEVEESVEQIRLNAVEEGRIAGVAEVEKHPNDYDLFTEDQYLEAGENARTDGVNEGNSTGVSYARDYPNRVEMYFEIQVRQAETIRYGDDYWAGHAVGKKNKLKDIRIGFATKGLSQAVLAESYPVRPYTRGWYFQPGWGWMMTNEGVFPQVYRAGTDGVSTGWMEAGQHPDQPAGTFYDSTSGLWEMPPLTP